jgi:hypothetical protein
MLHNTYMACHVKNVILYIFHMQTTVYLTSNNWMGIVWGGIIMRHFTVSLQRWKFVGTMVKVNGVANPVPAKKEFPPVTAE